MPSTINRKSFRADADNHEESQIASPNFLHEIPDSEEDSAFDSAEDFDPEDLQDSQVVLPGFNLTDYNINDFDPEETTNTGSSLDIEIPDSQEDRANAYLADFNLGEQEPPTKSAIVPAETGQAWLGTSKDDNSGSSSFETTDTEIIPGGIQFISEAEPRYVSICMFLFSISHICNFLKCCFFGSSPAVWPTVSSKEYLLVCIVGITFEGD